MESTNIIEKCVNTTIQKYQEDKERFIRESFQQIFNNDNYNLFTKENDSRKTIMILGKEALTVELIYGALLAREIEIANSIAKDNSNIKNVLPINITQAQNQIFDKINQANSSVTVYADVQNATALRDNLISSYAHLIANTSKEQRQIAQASLLRQMPFKIYDLDKLQTYLIDQNQNKIVEMERNQQNMVTEDEKRHY